nr:hypothetical protein [Nostoc sp. CreGUA01]
LPSALPQPRSPKVAKNLYLSHLQMTFAMSKELQFLAGHRFRVKLTPMSNAKAPTAWSIYLKIAVK